MRIWITLTLVGLVMLSCGSGNEQADTSTASSEDGTSSSDSVQVVKLKDNKYTEYYPDGVNIKFKGEIDEQGRRMGRWVHYSVTGKELNSSEYLHDELHGVSVVRHPNGAIHYVGEYDHGKKIGKWVFRNEDGSIKYEEDYGEPEEK